MSKEIEGHILQLYEVKKLLGSGAYGHVWKVVDKQNKNEYALKKIFDAFHNEVDAQRTYRQITVLHELDHPNIIKLQRVFKAKNNKDLYLVFEFMEADLHSLVGQDILEAVHLKFVIFQILRALKYLHSAQLIHRDLKPSNILINSECEIKICDFGLVRSLTHEQQKQLILSEQVATRWYRSPQMLLGSHSYTKKTDVWSVGCIIAELLMNKPIFPGESTLNQMEKIAQFSGIPSQQNINSLQSDVAQNLLNQMNVKKRPLKQYFGNCNRDIVNLVLKMLQFNPNKRISIEEGLNSPIFQEFNNEKEKGEKDLCTKFILPELDDNVRLSLRKYRQIIYRDIQRRYGDVYMIPKSLCRSFHEESRKFQRSHHSFKKKVNRPEQKQQTSSSLFVKTKKEGSIHELVNGEKQKKLRNEPLTKYNSNVYKSPIKSYVVNDNKILPKVKSKKHLLHKSYITKQNKENIKNLYVMYNSTKLNKVLK